MAGGRALLSGPRSWCELLLARRFGIQNEKRNVTLCSQNGRWMTENSLPKRSSQSQDQRSTLSNIAALVGAGAMGMLGLAGFAHADEAEHGLQAPSYPWSHSGWFSSYDHASIRRGHQVYKEVCAACHAMSLVTYRDLIGVAYTEAEVKALASEIECGRWKMDQMMLARCLCDLASLPIISKHHMPMNRLPEPLMAELILLI